MYPDTHVMLMHPFFSFCFSQSNNSCHQQQINTFIAIFTLAKVITLSSVCKATWHTQLKKNRYLHAHNSKGNHMYSGGQSMPATSHLPKPWKRDYKTSTSLGNYRFTTLVFLIYMVQMTLMMLYLICPTICTPVQMDKNIHKNKSDGAIFK